MELYKTNIYIM